MSLGEWLKTGYNPTLDGYEEWDGTFVPMRPRWWVLTKFSLTAAVLAVGLTLLFTRVLDPTPLSVGVIAGVLGLYLLAGYFIHAVPTSDNFGLFGTHMDNPFTYEDDRNRNLRSLAMFLWPGRFASESLVEAVVLLRYAAQ